MLPLHIPFCLTTISYSLFSNSLPHSFFSFIFSSSSPLSLSVPFPLHFFLSIICFHPFFLYLFLPSHFLIYILSLSLYYLPPKQKAIIPLTEPNPTPKPSEPNPTPLSRPSPTQTLVLPCLKIKFNEC